MRSSLGLLVVLAAAVVGGVIAAHQQSSSSNASTPSVASPASPTPVPRHNTVDILPGGGGNGLAGIYAPSTLRIKVGQKVTWINRDVQDHTATADNGAFNTDVLGPRQSRSWTARKPGRYIYSCFIHSDMHGEIIVTP